MTEQQIQNKKIIELEKLGYYVIKLINTNKNGIPDLIALKPNKCVFIEVKKPGGTTSKLQDFRISELKKLGFNVEVFGL